MNTKFLFTLPLILGVFFFHSIRAQVPADLQQKLQDTLVHMKNLYHFKGLSASVSYKTAGSWKAALGESANGVNLTTDDLIGIGSNTKTFMAAMMLKLVENGQVHLNDTIGTWISGNPNINGQITIRQLLNHTSGIASYTNSNDFWDSVNVDINRIWTKQEILSKFVTTPSFPVGTNWEYSNTNFILVGLIAEQLVGKPVHQILRDSMLNPLALDHTFFPPYESPTYSFAQVYTDYGAGYTFWNFPFALNSAADAAGAIVSNADDNTKFWKALFNGQIIKKSTLVDSMLHWTPVSSAISYGLGIMKEKYFGNTVFSHGGTWIGQINSNLVDTNRNIFITVLSNQDSLDNEYTDKVVAALYKVMLNYVPTSTFDVNAENSNLVLYPNPASDNVYVDNHLPDINYISLYDMNGREVCHELVDPSIRPIQLNINKLANGMYIIRCGNEQKKYSSTLTIQK